MSMSIKLMADYSAHPLWDCDTGRNLPLDHLTISPGLRQALTNWAKRFDDTLNPDDPITSGFRTVAELNSFEEEGLRLWRQLQAELGPSVAVEYFSSVERPVLGQN